MSGMNPWLGACNVIFIFGHKSDGQTVSLDKHPMPLGNWFKVLGHSFDCSSFQMITKANDWEITNLCSRYLKMDITKQTVFKTFRLLSRTLCQQ